MMMIMMMNYEVLIKREPLILSELGALYRGKKGG